LNSQYVSLWLMLNNKKAFQDQYLDYALWVMRLMSIHNFWLSTILLLLIKDWTQLSLEFNLFGYMWISLKHPFSLIICLLDEIKTMKTEISQENFHQVNGKFSLSISFTNENLNFVLTLKWSSFNLWLILEVLLI